MKTHLPQRCRPVATALFLLAGGHQAAFAADPAPTPQKTHVLFMGAELSVVRNRVAHPVRTVTGSSFVIQAGGQEARVPVEKNLGLRVAQKLKLTERAASVTYLKTERVYSAANNPVHEWAAAQQVGMAMADQADLARGRLVDADAALNRAQSINDMNLAARATARDQAASSLNQANEMLRGDLLDPGVSAGRLQRNLNEALFDALSITFEVSAPRTLEQPYVVLIARYREPDDKPGVVQNWIHARALDPVSTRPQKVRIRQGGFPGGFEVQEVQVHLYDGAEEIATNVSPKRVELTRDEAFQYVLIEYIGAHKGASCPPAPAMGTLPADLHARLSAGQLADTVYVRVSPEGRPLGAFVDRDCDRKADEYVETAVRGLRFKPALSKGKPVEGVAPVVFSKLIL